MPPESTSHNGRCYIGDSGSGDNDTGDGSFPGGGHNVHQPTEWRADVSVQQAEASTSLAPAKPRMIENDHQSEVSICLPR